MITKEQRVHIETMPSLVACNLPTALYYGVMIAYCDITADATLGKAVFQEPIPWKIELITVMATCKVSSGGGTARVYDAAGNAITDAIAMTTVDTVTGQASMDITYTTIAKGSQIYVRTNGANDRGTVGVMFRILEA